MEARVPRRLVWVVAGTVAGAQVHDGGLVRLVGALGQVVQQLALGRVGDAGVLLDGREGEPEDGHLGGDLGEAVLEVALVEDVALAILDEEQDAVGVAELRGGVRVEGHFDACGKAGYAVVSGELHHVARDGIFEERVFPG